MENKQFMNDGITQHAQDVSPVRRAHKHLRHQARRMHIVNLTGASANIAFFGFQPEVVHCNGRFPVPRAGDSANVG